MQDILHSLTGSERLFPPPPAAASGDRCLLLRRHTNQSLKCPRCDSLNTKFCYYNNYNLSQPRHFCKSCRRYWTKGGVLRNVPVGGGCRKSKRSSSKSSSSKHLSSPSLYVDKSQPRDDAALTNINSSTDDISTIAVSASPVIPTNIPMLFHEHGASCMEKQATTTTASLLYGIEEIAMNDDNDNRGMLTEMGNHSSMIGPYGYGGVMSEKEGFGALDWEGESNGGEELELFVDHAYWSQQNHWDEVVVDHHHHHHQTPNQVCMNEWQWW